MTRRNTYGLTLALGMWTLIGCHENPGGPGDPFPAQGPILSDPVSRVTTDGPALDGNAAELVYVSRPPGQVQGDWVIITNLNTGTSVAAPSFDGGFDPVPIRADVGDQLLIVTHLAGEPVHEERVTVPDRLNPVVVRTRPPRGKRSVPLASFIVVVFSEPIDPSTVNSQNIRLTREGLPVPGTFSLRPDGFTVDFFPTELLRPSTEYELTIDVGILDLGGDPLRGSVTVRFTTAESSPDLARTAVLVGDSQAQIPGGTLGYDLVVGSLSAGGSPVLTADLPVRWTVTSGGGQLLVFQDATDAFGQARARWTLGPTQGEQTLKVQVGTSAPAAARANAAPRGPLLAYRFAGRTGQHSTWRLVTMDEDGSNVMTLGTVGGGWCAEREFDPRAWSADGGEVFGVWDGSSASSPDCRNNLMVISTDGSRLNQITSEVGEYSSVRPSRSGDLIAFGWRDFLDHSCGYRPYVADRGAHNRVLLSTRCADEVTQAIDWSPDGNQLVIERNWGWDAAPGRLSRIVVIDVDTGAEQDLGTGSNPRWAPDRALIAFSGGNWDNLDSTPTDQYGIWTMQPDGSGRARVWSPSVIEECIDSTSGVAGHCFYPRLAAWSPSGDRILVAMDMGRGWDEDHPDRSYAFVLNIATGETRNLEKGIFRGDSPDGGTYRMVDWRW